MIDQYYENSRPEILEQLPENVKRVLDVGCASGVFGKSLKVRYPECEVWGVEYVERAAVRARQHLDKVICNDILSALSDMPDNYFDLICFNDVLEHLVDPYSLLQKIKGKLKTGGVIVASIPNVRWCMNLYNLIFRRQWKYEEEGVLDRTHLRFFTSKSALEMFMDAGYSINKMVGINQAKPRLAAIILNIATLGFFSDSFYLQFLFEVQVKK